jgi:hypothetical protein
MKVLYSILRDSLCLEQEKFFEKYKYLSMQGTSLDILKHAAGFFKREDFLDCISKACIEERNILESNT